MEGECFSKNTAAWSAANPRWMSASIFKYAPPGVTAWVLSSMMRDENLQSLENNDYIAHFQAALQGANNAFKPYIRFEDPNDTNSSKPPRRLLRRDL